MKECENTSFLRFICNVSTISVVYDNAMVFIKLIVCIKYQYMSTVAYAKADMGVRSPHWFFFYVYIFDNLHISGNNKIVLYSVS